MKNYFKLTIIIALNFLTTQKTVSMFYIKLDLLQNNIYKEREFTKESFFPHLNSLAIKACNNGWEENFLLVYYNSALNSLENKNFYAYRILSRMATERYSDGACYRLYTFINALEKIQDIINKD